MLHPRIARVDAVTPSRRLDICLTTPAQAARQCTKIPSLGEIRNQLNSCRLPKMSSNSSDPLRNGSIFRMSLSSLRSPLPMGIAASSPQKPWASSSPRIAGGMQRPKPQYGIEAAAGAPFDRADTSMKYDNKAHSHFKKLANFSCKICVASLANLLASG